MTWPNSGVRLLVAVLLVGVAAAVAQPTATDDAARRVTVTAEGFNRDDAVQQALRKALEQGAGTQITSYSQVENFELIRDTIFSKAAGVVSDYRITKEAEGPGGTVILTIQATVKSDVLAAAWGDVQNALAQIGRPKIMVVINEYIDERRQEESIVAARIEEMFVKIGFDLVEARGMRDLLAREQLDAEREGDTAKLARLAKDAGAHVLIRGTANANRAGIESVYNVPAAFYNCDVTAKAYWTDTAKLIAAESLPLTRKGARSRKEYSPQAARAALVAATFPEDDRPRPKPPLAVRLFESVLTNWSEQVTGGRELVLEVSGLEFKQYVQLRKALGRIERVDAVNGDFTKGQGVYRLKAKLSAETLAEQLLEPPFDQLVEVEDLKPNRVQATAAEASAD